MRWFPFSLKNSKIFKTKLFRFLTPYLIFIIYRLLQLTWRVSIYETPEVRKRMESGEGFISAHWHGDETGFFPLLKKYRSACIVSTSRDGEIMNQLVLLFGGQTVRGSSTRGGTGALKGIIALKKQGYRPNIAVDGPKGPLHQVKPGVFQISRLTGLPIIPLSFHASRSYLFKKSWNQTRLPLPFSKITIQWGDTLPTLSKKDDPKNPDFQRSLAEKLHATKKLAVHKNQENRTFL